MPRCIDCRAEIEEGPVCARCAPYILGTLKALKSNRRPKRREYYRYEESRPEPPITLATIRFGAKGDS